MTEKFNYRGHEFLHLGKDFEFRAALGTFQCARCELEVFVGAKNPAYKDTWFDGKIVCMDDRRHEWVKKFLTCEEMQIKKLLE